MMRFIIIAATAAGLSGVAQADDAQRALAKSMGVPESWLKTGFSCGAKGCSQLDPKDDINNSAEVQEARRVASARITAETEIHLRKMGMSPDIARKATWAASHKPNSACAYWVRQLTADYENGLDRPDYDDKLVISVERSGTCERKNLD